MGGLQVLFKGSNGSFKGVSIHILQRAIEGVIKADLQVTNVLLRVNQDLSSVNNSSGWICRSLMFLSGSIRIF